MLRCSHDAGCYDGADSLYFAQWCEKKYSKIIAIEPDKRNYDVCAENLKSLENAKIVCAGLGAQESEHLFLSFGNSGSYVIDTPDIKLTTARGIPATGLSPVVNTIKIAALDALVQNETVGFIKMDIEGAELEALKGSKKTILRDKPLLAICVYHRLGDVLAIMNFIDSLNLGYRFWLRHYSLFTGETVLYASIL